MTLLVVSIAPDDRKALAALAARAWATCADAVEIRLDAYEDDPGAVAEFLASGPQRSWIITCRTADEGGDFHGDTMERVSRLIAAARGTGAHVDFEFADWRRSENIRQKILLAAADPAGAGHRLILSSHHLTGIPQDLNRLVADMLNDEHAETAKIAWTARNIVDSFPAFDLMRAYGKRVTAIAMGEAGMWTRALAGKLGSHATYASLDEYSATAPGQLTAAALLDQYGWRRTNAETRVYGVVGDPVGHSLSPRLFARWFGVHQFNGIYLPLRVSGGTESLHEFLDACRERPWLDVRGLSVTIPHKEAACAWVGEGADRTAAGIGAVNTLVMEGDSVRGFNSDCHAAIDSLTAALGGGRHMLAGLPVDVLGAGGSARAVVSGLADFGAKVTVYGRDPARTNALCERFHVGAAPWEQRLRRGGKVLINCTSIGLWPQADETPLPAEFLRGCELVFDLVYRPVTSRLLRDAADAGARILNGLDMFVRQAAVQFALWTGIEPDQYAALDWLRRMEGAQGPETHAGAGVDATIGVRRRPIVLIGARGSGKTTVGRALAARLGVDFADSDELVVQAAGQSIANIFALEGESGFRERERRAIDAALSGHAAVISLGGGAITIPQAVSRLRAAATVVWLTAAPEVLWQRVAADPNTDSGRPRLTEANGLEEMREVLRAREAAYRSAANVQVETGGRSVLEVMEQVLSAVETITG